MQMYVNIVKLELLFDNISELKSTQFREGRKRYKGIRGVAALTRKSIRKLPGDYGRAIRGNLGDAGKWRRQ